MLPTLSSLTLTNTLQTKKGGNILKYLRIFKHVRKFIAPGKVIPNFNQQDATFLDLFISTDALLVLGGSSAHHQEHITVHRASGIVNQYCY